MWPSIIYPAYLHLIVCRVNFNEAPEAWRSSSERKPVAAAGEPTGSSVFPHTPSAEGAAETPVALAPETATQQRHKSNQTRANVGVHLIFPGQSTWGALYLTKKQMRNILRANRTGNGTRIIAKILNSSLVEESRQSETIGLERTACALAWITMPSYPANLNKMCVSWPRLFVLYSHRISEPRHVG